MPPPADSPPCNRPDKLPAGHLPGDSLRVDRWLWFARIFKTRGLAARVVSAGHLRVNTAKVSKPAHKVAPGDTLTLLVAGDIRILRILALGTRRGPAPEAQRLYEDLTPKPEIAPVVEKSTRKGRPTKKDRRDLMRDRRDMLE